jgi:predicted amidohydrolase YtcJ
MFQEERLGSLAVGKQADLVLLNADVLKARFEDFANIKIQQTYVAGKRVY